LWQCAALFTLYIDCNMDIPGEHLDVFPERIEDMTTERKTLSTMIDVLQCSERTLDPPDAKNPKMQEGRSFSPKPCDSLPSDRHEAEPSRLRPVVNGVIILTLLLGLGAAWCWTPLKHWLELETIVQWGTYISEYRLAPLFVIVAYTLGGLVVFPVTLLVVATAIAFQPLTAFTYSLAGCIASAMVLFWVGHVVGKETVRKIAGKRLDSLSHQLSCQGLITIITIRVFPIGPYSVVNFVAGASHIKFRDYVIGTVIGLIPGILAITMLGDSLGDAIRHPGPKSIAVLAALVLVIIFVNMKVRRWLANRNKPTASDSPD